MKDWEQSKEKLKDTFHHTDSRVYMYTSLYLDQPCWDQGEHRKIGLKAFILTVDNISHTMIDKGVLAEFSQVEMLLGALTINLRGKFITNLELDPRDPSKVKYDKL